jgi:hypothetical protein
LELAMPGWVVHPIVVLVERRHWIAARVAALAVVVVTAAAGHAAWNVATPYAAHYRLHDRTLAIVRTHAARSDRPGDTPELRSALMHAVRSQGLEAQIQEGDFQIEATAFRIRIACRYFVTVQILPGVRHSFPLRLHVEEPVLPKPETIFL